MSLHITPNRAVTWAKPQGKTWHLEELQASVDGWIEVLHLSGIDDPNGLVLVVNERGIELGLRENELASQLAGRRIVGNVLLTTYLLFESEEEEEEEED